MRFRKKLHEKWKIFQRKQTIFGFFFFAFRDTTYQYFGKKIPFLCPLWFRWLWTYFLAHQAISNDCTQCLRIISFTWVELSWDFPDWFFCRGFLFLDVKTINFVWNRKYKSEKHTLIHIRKMLLVLRSWIEIYFMKQWPPKCGLYIAL